MRPNLKTVRKKRWVLFCFEFILFFFLTQGDQRAPPKPRSTQGSIAASKTLTAHYTATVLNMAIMINMINFSEEIKFYMYFHLFWSLHNCHTSLHLSADVIHTVGPIAQGGVGEEEKKDLRSCYKNSLKAATQNAARSVVRTDG